MSDIVIVLAVMVFGEFVVETYVIAPQLIEGTASKHTISNSLVIYCTMNAVGGEGGVVSPGCGGEPEHPTRVVAKTKSSS